MRQIADPASFLDGLPGIADSTQAGDRTAPQEVQLDGSGSGGQVAQAVGGKFRGPAGLAIPVGQVRQVQPQLGHERAVAGH